VLESAVEITSGDAPGQSEVLHAGERTTFTRQAIDAAQPASGQDSAWTRGQIVADNMRLADFLAELARYRPGIVRCEGNVANLRVSGVFPLNDPDRILAILPKVLPVQVRLRTRYWVTVEAAS
jgi:transmembrane sensor